MDACTDETKCLSMVFNPSSNRLLASAALAAALARAAYPLAICEVLVRKRLKLSNTVYNVKQKYVITLKEYCSLCVPYL